MDDADPEVLGRPRGGVDRLPVDEDPPASRRVDAGQDLHQGRLARAVLADERVDLARAELESALSSAWTPGKSFDVDHLDQEFIHVELSSGMRRSRMRFAWGA